MSGMLLVIPHQLLLWFVIDVKCLNVHATSLINGDKDYYKKVEFLLVIIILVESM